MGILLGAVATRGRAGAGGICWCAGFCRGASALVSVGVGRAPGNKVADTTSTRLHGWGPSTHLGPQSAGPRVPVSVLLGVLEVLSDFFIRS